MTIEANDEAPPGNVGRMKRRGPVVLGVAVTAVFLAGVIGVASTRANLMGVGEGSSA